MNTYSFIDKMLDYLEQSDIKVHIIEEDDGFTVLLRKGNLSICRIYSMTVEDYTISLEEVNLSKCFEAYRNLGLGALLYNILLIKTTEHGSWLVSDRDSVSDNAEKVWRRWMDTPQEFETLQLDINIKTDPDFRSDWLNLHKDELELDDWWEDSQYWLLEKDNPPIKQTPFFRSKLSSMDIGRFQRFWQREDAIDLVYASPLTKAYKIKNVDKYLRLLKKHQIE